MATWAAIAAEGDTSQWLWRRYLPTIMAPTLIMAVAIELDPKRLTRGVDLVAVILAPATFILLTILSTVIFRNFLLAAAPRYGAVPDQAAATKLAIYVGTPVWLSALPGAIPQLGIAFWFLAILYAVYLLNAGAPLLMPPAAGKERAFGEAAIVRLFLTVLVMVPIAVLTLFGSSVLFLAIATTYQSLSGG